MRSSGLWPGFLFFWFVCLATLGPPLHTGAADSGHARKVPQLNKQGAPRGPWGRWAGWWAGLWRGLRLVKLPLLIEQARDDDIDFFYQRGFGHSRPLRWLRETATARARLVPSVASAHGRWLLPQCP